MKALLLALLISAPMTNLFSQQSSEWIKNLENPRFPGWELGKTNKLSEYINQDFSDLLTPKTNILGFIGSTYRRIEVKFRIVRKSANIKNVYHVVGYTTVSNNTCDFEGTIIIEQIREFEKMHFGADDKYKGDGIKAEGILVARYQFGENPEQKHVGIFEGVMTAWWYLDKNGKVQYDDLENHSDRYINNQYVGSWKEYGESVGKICNWGEFRIPFSNDLDIGAGEFSPNPKYSEMGWNKFN